MKQVVRSGMGSFLEDTGGGRYGGISSKDTFGGACRLLEGGQPESHDPNGGEFHIYLETILRLS
jgi:hypothetical protein